MFHEFAKEKHLVTTSLEEVVDAVEGPFRTITPLETTLDAIQVRPDGLVQVEGFNSIPMTQTAFEMLNKIAGIPPVFARSISEDHWRENFRAMTTYNKRTIWITATVGPDANIVAFATNQKVQARNRDLLNLFANHEDYEPKMIRLWNSGMQASFAARALGKIEPIPGDTSEIGIKITNSQIGLLSAKLEAMTFRFVCSNGTVLGDIFGRGYWPCDKRISYAASFAALSKQFSDMHIDAEKLRDIYDRSVGRLLTVGEVVALWRRVERATHSREVADGILLLGAEERKEFFRGERERHEFAEKTGSGVSSPRTTIILYNAVNNITDFAREAGFEVSHRLEEVAGAALNLAQAA